MMSITLFYLRLFQNPNALSATKLIFFVSLFRSKITYIRIYRIGCLFFFGLGLFPFTWGRSSLFSTSIERGIVPGLYLIEHCLGLFWSTGVSVVLDVLKLIFQVEVKGNFNNHNIYIKKKHFEEASAELMNSLSEGVIWLYWIFFKPFTDEKYTVVITNENSSRGMRAISRGQQVPTQRIIINPNHLDDWDWLAFAIILSSFR